MPCCHSPAHLAAPCRSCLPQIHPDRREIRPTADRGPILLCVDTSGWAVGLQISTRQEHLHHHSRAHLSGAL